MVVILRVLPAIYQMMLAVLGSVILFGMHLYDYLSSQQLPRTRPAGRQGLTAVLFVIPAHNEDTIIRKSIVTIRDQASSEYVYDTVIIADRCTDDTAWEALRAGAQVLCREDGQPGKQHALSWAFDALNRSGDLRIYDAVVVLDADNVLAPGAIEAALRALDDADACQMRVAPLNPSSSLQAAWYALCASWAAGIATARQVLGLQGILGGTGMVFKSSTLQQVPFRVTTLVDDWEYTCALTVAGRKVSYVPNAVTYNEAPDRWGNGYRQRLRWTRGGWQVLAKSFLSVLVRRPEFAFWLLTPVYNLIAATYCVLALVSPGNSVLQMLLHAGILFSLPALIQGAYHAIGGVGFMPVAWVMSFVIAWRALFSASNFTWYSTVHGEGRR